MRATAKIERRASEMRTTAKIERLASEIRATAKIERRASEMRAKAKIELRASEIRATAKLQRRASEIRATAKIERRALRFGERPTPLPTQRCHSCDHIAIWREMDCEHLLIHTLRLAHQNAASNGRSVRSSIKVKNPWSRHIKMSAPEST